MNKVRSIFIAGSLIAVAIPSAVYAMHCAECTDGQCKYLADKYSSGFYQMKANGCNYIVAPDDVVKATSEPLMKGSQNAPQNKTKSKGLSIGQPAQMGIKAK